MNFPTLVRRILVVVVVAIALWSPPVRADAVDDAFAAGNRAAESGDWSEAVQSFQRAASLAQHPSGTLSFNLGTAYLQLGDLGRATFHLRRALDYTSMPTGEVMERARRNLQVARRRAELQAAATDAKIDRPETWWDLVLEILKAPGIGLFALLSGWVGLGVLVLHRRRVADGTRSPAVTRAVLIVLGACFLALGSLHGLAARADRIAPQAVVLEPQVEAREGPGNHHETAFALQAGSRVRVVDRSPGWRRVRLPGGLEGWVPEKSVARLDPGGMSGQRPDPV